MSPSEFAFDRDRHVRYFSGCLAGLPDGYSKLDTNRLTLVHFAVHALDLLGEWDADAASSSSVSVLSRVGISKESIIDWIYSLQVPVRSGEERYAGFLGGTFLGGACPSEPDAPLSPYRQGHIAMTYTALASLRTLGDDYARLHRRAVVDALRSLQQEDGSFRCTAEDSEHDMRFLYCACCISHMLDDWSGVDVERAAGYIRTCRSFDGAIALLPGQEGHGGSTFCAVASLVLMQKLDQVIDEDWRRELVQWCVRRQVGGLQGRPNKDEDTCYSYWIGGTLRLLGHDDLLDHTQLRAFVMKCQTRMGGFSKVVGAFPDLLHAFYSMTYLSMSQKWLHSPSDYDCDDEVIRLKMINCTLGICEDRAALFQPIFP